MQQDINHFDTGQGHLRRRFLLLADLCRQIMESLDQDAVLQRVVSAACELTNARYGALGVFDKSGQIQDFFTHGLTKKERERIGPLPRGRGLLGYLQEHPQPLRLPDISKHERSVGFPPNHPPMKTFLGAPVRYENEDLGNLYLTEKIGDEAFTEEDQALLVLLASHAALAIRNSRLHTEVETERQRLQTLVSTSPIGVLVTDAARNVLLVNREAQRLFGRNFDAPTSLDEYRGGITFKHPDGSTYETEQLPIQRALDKGESVRAEEVRFELADGRTIPALINATPFFGPDQDISGAIATIQDLTPIEEIERLRSEFLGMVSHEVKTPLTAIKGAAAMAMGARTPMRINEALDLFQIIDEQADRIRGLVDNLLDMTRIEAGTLSVSPAQVNTKEMLDEAIAAFTRASQDHEVRLEVAPDLPAINVDTWRIGQVVNNLLSNAAKFSPAASPIDVTATLNSNDVLVSVRDYGRGIPSDHIHQLFRKFSQLPDNRGRVAVGHGLGLAICRGIVEAHGGRIWAESAGTSQGSTFFFTLPVSTGHVSPAPATAAVTDRSTHLGRVGHRGERTRIVAVDDEPQILRYLRRSLEDAGYMAIVTSDPQELVKLVELEQPDLVLLDLNLPGTTGLELLQRIREFSGVPAIILTAVADSEMTARALRSGADDYITKPFAPSELTARIEAALRRRVLPDQMEVRPPFRLHDLVINFADRDVRLQGQPIALSATEYKLLYCLATNAGRVMTHDQILRDVWGSEYSGETELVRSFIRNVRKKLGDDARKPRYILTEPQVGYRVPRPS